MDEDKELTGEVIETPSLLAAAINKKFAEYNDLMSKSATKDDWAKLVMESKDILNKIEVKDKAMSEMKTEFEKLQAAAKEQGEELSKMKNFYKHEEQRVPLSTKMNEFTSSKEFKMLADGNSSKAKFEIATKDVAFTGTYGSGAARQPFMPFDVPQGPDLENFDVRVVVPTGVTDSTSLEYPTERAASLTDATATKGENVALAESTLGFTMATATATKLGAFIEVSRAALRNTSWLNTYISGRLMAMWIKALNTQVIAGAGAGTDLTGLVSSANAFTSIDDSFLAGITSPNNFSVLNCAKGAMEENYFLTANSYFINPVDRVLMSESKDTTGNFIDTATFLNRNATNYDGVFGMRGISSADITAGTYLVASVSPANMQLLFNGPIEILATDSHASQFIADLVTIKIQGYAMLPIYKAGSLVTGTFATDIGNLTEGA